MNRVRRVRAGVSKFVVPPKVIRILQEVGLVDCYSKGFADWGELIDSVITSHHQVVFNLEEELANAHRRAAKLAGVAGIDVRSYINE
jgi:hypothetical protein